MPQNEKDALTDRSLADYVDHLLSGGAGEKDADMETRQLQTLAERLHKMTTAYSPPTGETTRRRLEVFNIYRQTIRGHEEGRESWLGRLSQGLSRVPAYALAAGFVGVLALVVAGALLAPQGGISAAAGLGGWLLPVVVLVVAGAALLVIYYKQRK
ncbi:MAG: hypothetical protein HYZ26_06025 [Chloroflexi bacterium]|nr:hypothetical protein [Chloroflexota bacterium]